MQHRWSKGAGLPGLPPLSLRSCEECGLLRVEELSGDRGVWFIRRRADDARVTDLEPECPGVRVQRFAAPW